MNLVKLCLTDCYQMAYCLPDDFLTRFFSFRLLRYNNSDDSDVYTTSKPYELNNRQAQPDEKYRKIACATTAHQEG